MRVRSSDDVSVELGDHGGEGPPLLVAHATGFCAGTYEPLIARMTERFHVWALDFRAHGDSDSPTQGTLDWRGMYDDVAACLAEIRVHDQAPISGLGHSMGGAALIGVELRTPGSLHRVYAYEPIIIPRSWAEFETMGNPLADGARRRRASFTSRQEALARYASRPPLGLFRADCLWSYVEHGFADQPDGTVALKCTPENEAATFEAPGKPNTEDLRALDLAIMIGRGEREGEVGPSGLAIAAADQLPRCQLRSYPHLGHFGPFQDPDTIADDALAFLTETGTGSTIAG